MRWLTLALLAAACGGRESPADAADLLLAADRAYAEQAAGTDLIAGIGAMLAPDAVMRAPGGRLAVGADEVLAVLVATPDNAGSRMTWAPVRVAISADGTHGVTYGYGLVTRPAGDAVPIKYLSYWVREGGVWRVSAYHRVPRPGGATPRDMLPAILPDRSVAPRDSGVATRFAAEVAAAEAAFSDTAQAGLARAFRMFGADVAMHMGGPGDATFRFGPDSIAAGVGDLDPGQRIRWGATIARAASSGDLGVSIGIIELTSPGPAGAPEVTNRFPFFTVWWRAGPGQPWRYIAE